MTESPYATLSLLFHWLSLWLGLYLLSRRPRTDVNLLAGGAIVCMSAYLLCIVLIVTATSLADAVLWTRVLGGWSSFAAVLFMHAMMALTGWRPPYRRALLAVAFAGGVILFALGFSDTLFYDYWAFSSLSTVESGGFRVGPLYVLGAVSYTHLTLPTKRIV